MSWQTGHLLSCSSVVLSGKMSCLKGVKDGAGGSFWLALACLAGGMPSLYRMFNHSPCDEESVWSTGAALAKDASPNSPEAPNPLKTCLLALV